MLKARQLSEQPLEEVIVGATIGGRCDEKDIKLKNYYFNFLSFLE